MILKQMLKDALWLSLFIFFMMLFMYIWYREAWELAVQYPLAITLTIVASVVVRALFGINKK